MGVTELSPRRAARTAAGAALLTGAYGFLDLSGVFGSVPCPADSAGGEGASAQGIESGAAVTATDTAQNCPGGLDYLLGGGGAPELFFWPAVLLGLVALGGVAAWTGRRRLTWAAVLGGVVVSGVGILSVGRYFVLPTLCLFVAATLLSVETRRASGTDE